MSLLESLPETLRDNPTFEKFEDVGALAQSYVELQSKLGKDKIVLPGEKATQDDWNAFYAAAGRPDAPDKYALPEDVQLPEGFKMDEAGLEEFKKVSHGLGLSEKQVAGLYKFYAENQGSQWKMMQESANEQHQEALNALQKEWGAGFATMKDRANRALSVALGDNAAAVVEKYGNDPDVIKAFANLGGLLSDDVLGDRGKGAGTETIQEAQSKINEIMTNQQHPYHVASHPEHNASVEEVEKLFNIVHAGKKE